MLGNHGGMPHTPDGMVRSACACVVSIPSGSIVRAGAAQPEARRRVPNAAARDILNRKPKNVLQKQPDRRNVHEEDPGRVVLKKLCCSAWGTTVRLSAAQDLRE